MLDESYCNGCENNFYNGKNPYGVAECWHRKDAKLGSYLLIHIDEPPPYAGKKPKRLPNCYQMSRHVKVEPSRITAGGYWRT